MAKALEKSTVLIEAARLYYEHGFSQQQIADKLGLSRPGISRLLQMARQQGIVRIEICDPAERSTQLETELQTKFNLKKVIIVPNDGEETTVIKRRLGQVAAKFLDQLVTEDLVLGVSWGSTMQAVVKQLRPRRVKNMVVVQLNGGVSRAEYNTHASDIAQRIGETYQATPFLLPLPAVVDNADLKRAIIADKNISRTLSLALRAQVVMFTVGYFNKNSVLVKADYFEPEEVELLLRQRAVADICSRIITTTGKICSPELDSRTIGIELLELSKKPTAIAVAGGKEKLPAIHAGLLGKHFNVLITDEWVASELLEWPE